MGKDCKMKEPEDEPKPPKRAKRESETASSSQQPFRTQPVRFKGDLKIGMEEMNKRIKELDKELKGLIAIRDAVIAGASKQEVQDEDEEEEEEEEEDDGKGA